MNKLEIQKVQEKIDMEKQIKELVKQHKIHEAQNIYFEVIHKEREEIIRL